MKTLKEQYNKKSIVELKKDLNDVLNHSLYKINDYTNMMKGMINKSIWSDKQKNAVIMHIINFWEKVI